MSEQKIKCRCCGFPYDSNKPCKDCDVCEICGFLKGEYGYCNCKVSEKSELVKE